MPVAHKTYLKEMVHATRTMILERFLNNSVSELRGLLLLLPPAAAPPATTSHEDGAAERGDQDSGEEAVTEETEGGAEAEGKAGTEVEAMEDGKEGGEVGGGGPRGALEANDHAEALELAVDLLLHYGACHSPLTICHVTRTTHP